MSQEIKMSLSSGSWPCSGHFGLALDMEVILKAVKGLKTGK